MPKIRYVAKNFRTAQLLLIGQANQIIEEYAAEGFTLTLRQLYYQFVARDIIPNTQNEYNRIGSVVNNARLAGLIDWDAIEDRTRFVRSNPHWDEPQDIVGDAAKQFRIDKWEGQEVRLEVWIEKDALIGIIEGACTGLDVPLLSCRGYVSQSEMWRAAQRFEGYLDKGQKVKLVHLGDHDPSGIDMTRDISDRLETFCVDVEVERIALNQDQIQTYSPPPNPAKITDSRYESYKRKYGQNSWELDALDPRVLANLTKETIRGNINPDPWNSAVSLEKSGRENIGKIAGNWQEAVMATG